MTITSITVPSHSTRSSPSLHVVYRILVTDDEKGEYEVWRRYREFSAFDRALRAASGVPNPPKSLPAHTSVLPTAAQLQKPFTSFLEDEFLHTRRAGLEQYLQAIAFAKHRKLWTETLEWKDFLSKDAAHKKKTQQKSKGVPFKGANSYYLHTLAEADRISVLDALSDAGFTVVRIFINQVAAGNKGSNNQAVNDLEPNELGVYDDTVLELIDQLMYEMSARGMQLIIACHDRYSLGYWETDQYALTYGIVQPGTSGAQQVTDASAFYTNNGAMTYFDHRIDHILAHENSVMSNTTWGNNPSGVIYSIEAENEPFGYMDIVNTSWISDRSGRIVQNLGSNSGILVSNGGGVDISTSTASSKFTDYNVDVICVHDYSTDPFDTMPTVSSALGQAESEGKTLIFEEWGATGSSKSSIIYNYVEALYDYDIAYLVWEVVIPGAGNSDYEIWKDDGTDDWANLIHTPTGD